MFIFSDILTNYQEGKSSSNLSDDVTGLALLLKTVDNLIDKTPEDQIQAYHLLIEKGSKVLESKILVISLLMKFITRLFFFLLEIGKETKMIDRLIILNSKDFVTKNKLIISV